MIRPLLAAALLIAPQAAAAQEPSPPCLTAEEAGDMMLMFAPSLIEGAAGKCGPTLAPGAFLQEDYKPMVERLRGESSGRWGATRSALEKMTGSAMPDGMSDETIRKAMEEVVAHELVGGIKAADCGAVDSLVRALSPLPAGNFGALITAVLSLAGDKDDDGPFRICTANPA